MKSVWCCLVGLLIFECVKDSTAWVGLEKFSGDESQTSHCFTTSYGVGSMDRGETRRLEKQCAEATCEDNRDVRMTGCAGVAAQPPCYVLPGNLSKPFPECCYEIFCKEKVSADHDSNYL